MRKLILVFLLASAGTAALIATDRPIVIRAPDAQPDVVDVSSFDNTTVASPLAYECKTEGGISTCSTGAMTWITSNTIAYPLAACTMTSPNAATGAYQLISTGAAP